jgi:hypothetical protein
MPADSFITQLLQIGVGGIDLKRTLDLISPLRLARMTNWSRDQEGGLQPRPGQKLLTTIPGAANVHSLARLQAAQGDDFIRLLGADGQLWMVDSFGFLSLLDSGFSGAPFTFVTGRPPLSGDSWLYIGDGVRMRKVRSPDGLVTPIGLRPPAAAPVAVASARAQTVIDLFESADWTNNAGTGTAPSNVIDPTNLKEGASSVSFLCGPAASGAAAYNFWGKALSRDLSKLISQFGLIDSGDDDQFHLWMRLGANAAPITELRVYFVISDNFSSSVVPGTSTTANTDAYVKSFIPSLFTSFVQGNELAPDFLTDMLSQTAGEGEATGLLPRLEDVQAIVERQAEQRALAQRQLALGLGAWSEFGAAGLPLRRSEFLRIGSDPDFGWATMTGMIFLVRFSGTAACQVNLDDLYMIGGAAPDTSAATSVEYDWRYRHFDPRTGARSRLSPEMEEGLDVVRTPVRLFPEAYGDPAIRQEFFRRGGTLKKFWYFVGRNSSDGGCGTDRLGDVDIQAATTIDDAVDYYHEPITTVDAAGNTVYAQPIPVIFGPVAGLLFGLGDPYRKGHLYWTLVDEYDHWPPLFNTEVCSPSEELMAGAVFANQAWAFSRERMFGLLINFAAAGTVQAIPSSCNKGAVSRYAVAVGLDGIYFVSPDGVNRTTGGVPQNITDDYLQPLFQPATPGEAKNSYFPIDFDIPEAIRLDFFRNELWFVFQDTSGRKQAWIYSLIYSFWRHYDFDKPISAILAEQVGTPFLLMGGALNGEVFSHEGLHDSGAPIHCAIRSGALNMGFPRQSKLFGDLSLEADLRGMELTVNAYKNSEASLVQSLQVSPLVGRQVYLIDAFGSTPLKATDVSIELIIEAFDAVPMLFRMGPSFIPQPEAVVGRGTDWDFLGGMQDKTFKGVLIEADTFGQLKHLEARLDGLEAPARSFTLQTAGRQIEHIAFDPIVGRLIKLAASGEDQTPWIPYQVRWLFDSDPLMLDLWETQFTDHGLQGSTQTMLYSYITIIAPANVTLEITVREEDGTTRTEPFTIAGTAGEKVKRFVPFTALKGVLFKYRFQSSAKFRLFREESIVYVQAWGAQDISPVQPFGTDNLDTTRIVRDAEGTAIRGARWLDTSQAAGED